jgi:SAM-dependent methyltransferase
VARVLDLCCGTGLMTAELARRGMEVVGVDASPAMLARARARLGPDVQICLSVLPDLPVAGPFDAAVSTLDGLNYLSLEDLRRTFAAVGDRLRRGGWMVFDVHAESALVFLRDHPVIHGEQGGDRFVLTSTVDTGSGACSTTIAVTADAPERSFTEQHVQYVHSEHDIRDALEAAAFTVRSLTDEYTDRPVGPDTLRATWAAIRD